MVGFWFHASEGCLQFTTNSSNQLAESKAEIRNSVHYNWLNSYSYFMFEKFLNIAGNIDPLQIRKKKHTNVSSFMRGSTFISPRCNCGVHGNVQGSELNSTFFFVNVGGKLHCSAAWELGECCEKKMQQQITTERCFFTQNVSGEKLNQWNCLVDWCIKSNWKKAKKDLETLIPRSWLPLCRISKLPGRVNTSHVISWVKSGISHKVFKENLFCSMGPPGLIQGPQQPRHRSTRCFRLFFLFVTWDLVRSTTVRYKISSCCWIFTVYMYPTCWYYHSVVMELTENLDCPEPEDFLNKTMVWNY